MTYGAREGYGTCPAVELWAVDINQVVSSILLWLILRVNILTSWFGSLLYGQIVRHNSRIKAQYRAFRRAYGPINYTYIMLELRPFLALNEDDRAPTRR